MTTQREIPPPGPKRDKMLAELLGGSYSYGHVMFPKEGLITHWFEYPSRDDHSAFDLVCWLSTRKPKETQWGLTITHHYGDGVGVIALSPGLSVNQPESVWGDTYAAAVTEAILRAAPQEPDRAEEV